QSRWRCGTPPAPSTSRGSQSPTVSRVNRTVPRCRVEGRLRVNTMDLQSFVSPGISKAGRPCGYLVDFLWRRCHPGGVEYRVLGPLDVISPGTGPVKIEGAKTRALLVLLLLSRNSVVSADRIAEDLWAGMPPPSAAGTIHAYVSKLRRALTDAGQPPPLVTRK